MTAWGWIATAWKMFLMGCAPARSKPAATAAIWASGLTVCRTIVNAHGGQITAANRPQGGASFCITLPLAEIEEEEHDE